MNGNSAVLELDAPTAQLLEDLAKVWGVSKEEAVRRAVAQADATSLPANKQSRLDAFKELQRRLNLTSAKAAAWQNIVREARR